MRQSSKNIKNEMGSMSSMGRLIVGGTPLGNLQDVSPRLIDILKNADLVLSEDTRVTLKLYNALGLVPPKLKRFDQFLERELNEEQMGEVFLNNKSVVLLSDAGLPGISDPGTKLIEFCHQNRIEVDIVPGPSAAVLSAVLSGFALRGYGFYGFFPRERTEVLELIAKLKTHSILSCYVFYESPKRILKSVQILAELIPEQKICLCKELTKLHQKIFLGKAPEVLGDLKQHLETEGELGEWTLSVEFTVDPYQGSIQDDREDVWQKSVLSMIECGVRVSEGASSLARIFNSPKNKIYSFWIEQIRKKS